MAVDAAAELAVCREVVALAHRRRPDAHALHLAEGVVLAAGTAVLQQEADRLFGAGRCRVRVVDRARR